MDISQSQNFLAPDFKEPVSLLAHNRSISKDSSMPISQLSKLKSERNFLGEGQNPLSIKPEFKYGQARPYKPSQNLTTREAGGQHFKAESSRGRMEDYVSSFKSKLANNSFLQTDRPQKLSNQHSITVGRDFTEI